jgi:hypothetical protein
MSDKENNSLRFTTGQGVDYELTGYRLEHGDWVDLEKGGNPPGEGEWEFIELVTLNLEPDTEDGFYRSARVIAGFDEDYELDDLADEMAHSYGFLPA